MNLIEELKSTLRMEVRGNSHGHEYLEAVVVGENLELLRSLLVKHLGLAAKEPEKEVALSPDIQGLVDSLGGLRVGQSFFYKKNGEGLVCYAALWPWESNPEKVTLKTGLALV